MSLLNVPELDVYKWLKLVSFMFPLFHHMKKWGKRIHVLYLNKQIYNTFKTYIT